MEGFYNFFGFEAEVKNGNNGTVVTLSDDYREIKVRNLGTKDEPDIAVFETKHPPFGFPSITVNVENGMMHGTLGVELFMMDTPENLKKTLAKAIDGVDEGERALKAVKEVLKRFYGIKRRN